MKKDFVTVPNASGNNNGSFDVTCEQNTGDERSTILTVSGGGVNKTIDITQKTSILESIEIAGSVYASNGNLVGIRSFGMSTDIRLSMINPQKGRFMFPIPIQEIKRFNTIPTSFLRIQVSEEIPSHYKGERVIGFFENSTGNLIYAPRKEFTANVYRMNNAYVFELNIVDGITIDDTEIINANSALNNKLDIVIMFTNNKIIQLINFVWKVIYHEG